MSKTIVGIEGDRFFVNQEPVYKRTPLEGLLMNARLVQGVFDDLNPQTRERWDYPDGPWDPNRNTDEFIAAMADWKAHHLAAFTINLQGGSPEGYSKEQPWENSAFVADGGLRPSYMDRLARILDAADRHQMAVILGLFYFGQDERLADERAVIAAVDNVTDWLLARGDCHVLVEIANEADVPRYEHEILLPEREHELIQRVQSRSRGRLAVSTSMRGGSLPTAAMLERADFVLLHGNHVDSPAQIRQMIRRTRDHQAYKGQPILFNEDDHFDFDADDNNMCAAVQERCGWGYFDYRMQGEGFDEGYQSVPVNWRISSDRKRGFFNSLKDLAEGNRQT